MKKYFAILTTILLLVCFASAPVFAGDLNENELAALEFANSVFTYNGRQYVATAAAKDIARNYMLRDDIDLTAAQVSKAIDMCFGSIARGIAEGYLVPYGNGSSDAPAPSGGTSETTYKTVVGSKEYEEIEVQIDELMDALDEAVASANTASEAATKASGNAEAATEAANAAASAAEKAAVPKDL